METVSRLSPAELFLDKQRSYRKVSKLEQDAMIPTHIGDDVYLDFVWNDDHEQACSSFVGCGRRQYFIVETPKKNSETLVVDPDIPVHVRYFCNGKVLGFQSKVKLNVGPPLNLTVLDYPLTLEEVSLRRSPRLPLVVSVLREGAVSDSEFTMNISATGALLKLLGEVKVGEEVVLSFALPNGVSITRLSSIVRRAELKNNNWLVGVEFDRNHPEQRLIEDYVDRAIAP